MLRPMIFLATNAAIFHEITGTLLQLDVITLTLGDATRCTTCVRARRFCVHRLLSITYIIRNGHLAPEEDDNCSRDRGLARVCSVGGGFVGGVCSGAL